MIQAARQTGSNGAEVTLLIADPRRERGTARAGGLPLTERLIGRRRTGLTQPAADPPFEGWPRYHDVELIGEGGMGRVFRAFDPTLDRHVALKFPRNSEHGHGGRTLYEARLQARVEGEHVPKVYEVGDLAGHAYFAMQFVDGPLLKEARPRLPFDERLTVALRMCDALEEVHARGLVHRDVNPRNVLLAPRPDGSWWPYLVDFGIAHELPHPSRPVNPEVVGTAPYMAPEQALGKIFQIDRRTDVYSLGATLYELFSGQRPFAAESSEKLILRTLQDDPVPLSAVAPNLPPALGEMVGRCLEKEPADRFPSARAAAAALTACRRN
jgi:serine/threonine-protein kinase